MGKKDKEEKMILEKPKADKIIKKKRRSSAAASGTSLYVSPIASPLANERQTKNVLRLTKKGIQLSFHSSLSHFIVNTYAIYYNFKISLTIFVTNY